MTKFFGWIAAVLFLLVLFRPSGFLIFFLPLGLSFYLLFRNYLFAGHGVLLAVVFSIVQTRDAMGWGFGVGGFPLLSTSALLILLGLIVGGTIDFIVSRKQN